MESVKTATEDFGGGKQSPSADRKDRISPESDQHDANDAAHDANDAGELDVEALLNRPRPRPFSLRMGRRSMYEAPEFVRRLGAFEEAEAGSTVIFECQWKGFPRPAIKWYKDDEEITENPRYQTTAGDNGVLALVIEEANKADEGAYKCKVENQEGVASTTGYLSVSGEVTEKPLAAQPRKNVDHSVSSAPPLRTILEQRTLEAEEEEELSQQPPSPIQDFIDSLPLRMRGKSRKKSKGDSEEADGESSGSDTSVDSQDFDRVPDRDRDLELDPDLNTGNIQTEEATMQQDKAGPQTQATAVQEIPSAPQVVQQAGSTITSQTDLEGQHTNVNPQTVPQSEVNPQVVQQAQLPTINTQTAQEVQQSNVNPEAAQEMQNPNKEPQTGVAGEAEDSLARVPSDKAMSLFTTSVSGDLTPSPSVDDPDADVSQSPASVTFNLQEQPSTETAQPATQPQEVSPPGQKVKVAAGPQQPDSSHKSEMVLVLGSQKQPEVSRSTENVTTSQVAVSPAENVPTCQVVISPAESVSKPQVAISLPENVPTCQVVVLPAKIVPQTTAIATVNKPHVAEVKENIPQVKVIMSPLKQDAPPMTQVSVPPTSVSPDLAQSAENVPQAGVSVVNITPHLPGSTGSVPVMKETTPSVKPEEHAVSQEISSMPSKIPEVTKPVGKIPQTTVTYVTTTKPLVAESAGNVTQVADITSSSKPDITSVPQVAVVSHSTPPQVAKSIQKVPQPVVTVTTINPYVSESKEIVPQVKEVKVLSSSTEPNVSAAVPRVNVIVSSMTTELPQTQAPEQPAETPVTAAPEPGAVTCPAHAPRVTIIDEAGMDEAKKEGTVSHIIKLVKQKSMAMEETLRIPWLYYFAFTVFAAFIAVATDCSPLTYICVIAVVSLISFRVLVEITCKEEKK